MKKILLLPSLLIVLNFPALGQLQTKTVSIFKNNKAFFIKGGTVNPKGTQYQLGGEMPRALFGTLWFQSQGSAIKLVSSDEQNIEKQGIPINNYELLKANINKKVTVFLSPTENIEGIVQSFSKDYDDESKTWFVPAFVTLKSIDKWHTVKIDDIKRIAFVENPVNSVTSYEKKKVISIEFNENKVSQPLSMMYLEDGLGWSPNYLLELTSESKGILTLQAQVKNDAEDIKNTDISFVAGVANFKDANKLAWLMDFLPGVTEDYSLQPGAYSNTSYYKSDMESAAEPAPSSEGDGVEGEATEDMFFYNLKNLSLLKGSRAQVELFKAEVALEHTYETRLVDMNGYNLENYVFQVYGTEDKTSKTWHSIKMTNQTKYPWTSGLCFVVNKESLNSKPVSQDQLYYTPLKGDVSLKITESPDIKVEHSEKESDRKTNIRRNREIQYDLVTVDAEIKVKNYKSKSVKMNIKRLVLGELMKSSTDWKKNEKINYNSSLNKSADVNWEPVLKAGEELIIRYTYKITVRAN